MPSGINVIDSYVKMVDPLLKLGINVDSVANIFACMDSLAQSTKDPDLSLHLGWAKKRMLMYASKKKRHL